MELTAASLEFITTQQYDSLADYWRTRIAEAWTSGDITKEAFAIRILHSLLAAQAATIRTECAKR